jgi:hypothetical protein
MLKQFNEVNQRLRKAGFPVETHDHTNEPIAENGRNSDPKIEGYSTTAERANSLERIAPKRRSMRKVVSCQAVLSNKGTF